MGLKVLSQMANLAHSNDFRWFGPDDLLSEWDLLVSTFNHHKYEVTDTTNKEFVGIHICHNEDFNNYMDQPRMITSMVEKANLSGAKDKKLPYPMDGNPLSKSDCTTEESKADNFKYPYPKVAGQLMYGMIHTTVNHHVCPQCHYKVRKQFWKETQHLSQASCRIC